jgi:hypothetical protein
MSANLDLVRSICEPWAHGDWSATRGVGKTSGMEIGRMAAKGAELFKMLASKVTRVVIYFDRESAIAGLGLEG